MDGFIKRKGFNTRLLYKTGQQIIAILAYYFFSKSGQTLKYKSSSN